MKIRNRKGERGFVLVAVYLVEAVLILFGGALVLHGVSEMQAAQRSQQGLKSFCLAEAGIDQAIASLRNPAFAGSATDGPSDPEVGYTALGEGGYEVDVDPVAGLPNRYRIQAIGYYSSNQVSAPGFQRRILEAYVAVTPNPLFGSTLFGDQQVELTGNAFTDSYRSSQGPYVPGGTAGDVGTNSVTQGGLRLTGNAVVHGDALVGPSGDPNTVISLTGNADITGSSSAAAEVFPMQPVVIPEGVVNQGQLTISGNTTVTLSGGTYRFDLIRVSGNGRLNFTGPATVYLTGELQVSGNGIGTADNLPPHLILYSQGISSGTSGSGDISFSGNGVFYGAVYAPSSKLSVTGNGALFGALIGREARVTGNGGIHYDEALQEVATTGTSQVNVLSWQDLS